VIQRFCIATIGTGLVSAAASHPAGEGLWSLVFDVLRWPIDGGQDRAEVRARANLVDYLAFAAVFPPLVAGPIVRARDFLRQIPRHRPPRAAVWLQGGWLVVQGYFLKMVVADNLGSLVDPLWEKGYEPDANASTSLLLAVFFAQAIEHAPEVLQPGLAAWVDSNLLMKGDSR